MEKMTLNEAMSIVDDYIVLGKIHNNFVQALEVVYSAAEDWQFFAKGKNRAEYKAYLSTLNHPTLPHCHNSLDADVDEALDELFKKTGVRKNE